MTQKWLIGSALGLVMLFTSCDKSAPDTREADAKAITAIEEDWVKSMVSKDATKFGSYYASDASVYFPGMGVMRGSAAIEPALKGMMGDPNFSGSFKTTKVTVAKSGDLASSEGTYEQTMTDPVTKKKASDKGHYLTTWKKQENGSWKAISDMIASDMPPPAPAPGPVAKKKKR